MGETGIRCKGALTAIGLTFCCWLGSNRLAAEEQPAEAVKTEKAAKAETAATIPSVEERSDPDFADRTKLLPVDSKDYAKLKAFLASRYAEWEKLKGFSADLTILWTTTDGTGEKKEESITGRLAFRFVPADPHKMVHDKKPWNCTTRFADPAGVWSLTADEIGPQAQIEAKNEETKQKLRQLTADGQLFPILGDPRLCFGAFSYHFAEYTAEGQSTYSLRMPAPKNAGEEFRPEQAAFAFIETPADSDKTFILRDGQIYQWVFRMDGGHRVNKVFTYRDYTKLESGPLVPADILMDFGGATIRLTLRNLTPEKE